MNNISEKTLDAIIKNEVKPWPRWVFIAKNLSFWLLGFLSLGLGAISFSLVAHIIDEHDWDVYDRVGGYFKIILLTLPYLWLGALLFFTISAYFYFRHSRYGYKYPLIVLLGTVLTLSLIIGLALYFLGWGRLLHRRLSDNFPSYDRNFNAKKKIWQQPNNGLLGGVILKMEPDNNFELEDFNRKIWHIRANQSAIIKQREKKYLNNREKIKIIGHQTEEQEFYAEEIRPWEGSGIKIKEAVHKR